MGLGLRCSSMSCPTSTAHSCHGEARSTRLTYLEEGLKASAYGIAGPCLKGSRERGTRRAVGNCRHRNEKESCVSCYIQRKYFLAAVVTVCAVVALLSIFVATILNQAQIQKWMNNTPTFCFVYCSKIHLEILKYIHPLLLSLHFLRKHILYGIFILGFDFDFQIVCKQFIAKITNHTILVSYTNGRIPD